MAWCIWRAKCRRIQRRIWPVKTREVLETIDRLLNEVGSDKSRILMAQIFLPDLADYAAMNAVWDQWVVAGHAPPRATVQAQLANPAWKIEVVVTAAVR
jgi:enamine deaminase RidA (YjgF/YER057c/UK114 family)